MARKKTSKYGIKSVGKYDIQDIKVKVVGTSPDQSIWHGKPTDPMTRTMWDHVNRQYVVQPVPYREFDNDVQHLDVEFIGYSWMNSGVRVRVTVHDPVCGPYEATMNSSSFFQLVKQNVLVKGRTTGTFTWEWNGQHTDMVYLGV